MAMPRGLERLPRHTIMSAVGTKRTSESTPLMSADTLVYATTKLQFAIINGGMVVCEDEGHSDPQKLKAAHGGRFLF
jgi:hypothetical protein